MLLLTVCQLNNQRSGLRSHLVRDAREKVLHLYNLEVERCGSSGQEINMSKESRARSVRYLLHNHRFMCHPSKLEVAGWRFLCPMISSLLFHRFFSGRARASARQDGLIQKINKVTICLAATCLENALQEYERGEFVSRGNFRNAVSSGKYAVHSLLAILPY